MNASLVEFAAAEMRERAEKLLELASDPRPTRRYVRRLQFQMDSLLDAFGDLETATEAA